MKIQIDRIFKNNDKVYHWMYGWGTIIDSGNNVCFDESQNVVRDVFAERHLLSFTRYIIEGFSQERPEELPNIGDVVWVRDDDEDMWIVTHFVAYHPERKYHYLCSENMSKDFLDEWKHITTKNPYKDEKI